ncbi:MAG: crosslink repair DNA glycosylase YcaQ family protein [Betaproteobacteria bacterium]
MPRPVPLDLDTLRRYAVGRAFPRSPDAERAVERLGFVQYDPIRAPATAQDLILRHRVDGYRAGDLDRAYPGAALEEAFLHVYGVMSAARANALHPRGDATTWRVEREHPMLARRVMRHANARETTHPRTLALALDAPSTTGGWGGESSASTRVLDMLHYRGRLRIVRRDAGIRVYAPARERPRATGPAARGHQLLDLLLRLYAPLPTSTLRQLALMVRGAALGDDRRARAIETFTRSRGVAHAIVDGVRYLWPADEDPLANAAEERVRMLAPFDPLTWDRRRFEHLWGWGYRFEAYTPADQRQYGYYALPLLWRERVVGWANAQPAGEGFALSTHFVGAKPRDPAFLRALDEEVDALTRFARRGRKRGAAV